MLPFERRIVDALTAGTLPEHRDAVIEHVALTLAAMPEVTRAGFAAESIAFGAWSAVRSRVRPTSAADDLARLERHPVSLVRQWVRALRALVLFAEQELIGAEAR
ncbi:MAG: hypothetical protein GXY13_11725 [Acidimicrobiales bacterium]|nr:hypothetical protein [Acidimicrobiales bacterium]